jgi:peptide/nickel transport system permease protein
MFTFTLRRLASMIVVILVLIAAVFVLQRLSPTDPVRAKLGPSATNAIVAAERKRLGYDDPLPVQYVRYVGDALSGNLQVSLRSGQPVLSDIGSFLPASLELVLFSLVLGVPLSLALGIASAARWRGLGAFRLGMLTSAAAPQFLLGALGILLFYHYLNWLPATGRTGYADAPTGPTGFLTIDGLLNGRPAVTLDAVRHLIMPALALALLPAVAVGRVLRGSMIANLRADHVRVARSKGLSDWQVLYRHCLRNSAGPALAMSGLMLGLVFEGLVIVETVFAWPGIGSYVAASIPKDDFPAIAGVTMLLGAAYVIVNTIVDLLQAAADPRIRT